MPFRWVVVLALTLFTAWVGAGAVHQHVEDPTCQLCKLLHSGAADVGRPPANPAPAVTAERIAILPAERPADQCLPLPKVRGPPLS